LEDETLQLQFAIHGHPKPEVVCLYLKALGEFSWHEFAQPFLAALWDYIITAYYGKELHSSAVNSMKNYLRRSSSNAFIQNKWMLTDKYYYHHLLRAGQAKTH